MSEYNEPDGYGRPPWELEKWGGEMSDKWNLLGTFANACEEDSVSPQVLAIIEAVLDETFAPKLLWHLAEINAWLDAEFQWSLRDERVRFSIPVEDTPCPKCAEKGLVVDHGDSKCVGDNVISGKGTGRKP